MCAPQGYAPLFWGKIVGDRFRMGNSFHGEEISEQIYAFYNNDVGTSVSIDSANITKTIFLGTYTKNDGLNALSFLDITSKGRYRVLEAAMVPTWVFLYALIDYWDAYFGDRVSINLDELTSKTGLANLFLLDNSRLNRILSELQQAGYVDVYRSAQPYQLLLLSHDKTVALRNLYGLSTSI
jgi:hypothetical protein